VGWISKDLGYGPLLHHTACVHDRYIVGQVGDYCQVVRDVQRSNAMVSC
jgi:hypothetical protein